MAQHEVGHYVACRHFGFRTGSISVEVDAEGPGRRGSAAVALSTPIESMQALEAYLFRRCVILLAGVLAEALTPRSASEDIHEEDVDRAREILDDPNAGAFADHAIAKELQFLLRYVRHPETPISDRRAIKHQTQTIIIEVWEAAKTLVGRYAVTICSVASIIADRSTEEGRLILMPADELEALAMIRDIVPIG